MKVIINDVEYVPAPELPKERDLLKALGTRFDSDAGDNITIRDYLYMLLNGLWQQGEGFSSKRPFGNSGWEYDLYKPLIAGGFIVGCLDEDGYVDHVDEGPAQSYVFELIRAAFYGVAHE